MSHSKQKQTGLTLVEILIALTLGLLVLAGVVQIFASTNQTAITQTEVARLQENTIFAKEYLLPQLRLGDGLSACAMEFTGVGLENHIDDTAAGYVDEFYNPLEAIVGWSYTNTGPSDTVTLGAAPVAGSAPAGNWVNHNGNFLPAEIQALAIPGSDVLYFKYSRPVPNLTACDFPDDQTVDINLGVGCPAFSATVGPVPPAINPRTGVPYTNDELHDYFLPQGSLVLLTDCTRADVFQKTNDSNPELVKGPGGAITPGNDTGAGSGWRTAFVNRASFYTLHSVAFFVGVSATSGNPALFRYDSATGRAVELIDNVENMQLELGELVGNNVVYREPDQVVDPLVVVAARLSFLMRSEPAGAGTDLVTYDLLGVTVDPPDDPRLRKVVDSTVSVRNRGAAL